MNTILVECYKVYFKETRTSSSWKGDNRIEIRITLERHSHVKLQKLFTAEGIFQPIINHTNYCVHCTTNFLICRKSDVKLCILYKN